MKKTLTGAIISILISLQAIGQQSQDTLYLKNGDKSVGKLLGKSETEYRFQTSDGVLFTFSPDEVEKIAPANGNISSKQKNSLRANTILLTGSSDYYTFFPGIKYQYCKSWGGYTSIKGSFGLQEGYNHTMVTVGPVISLWRKLNFYLGGGIEFITNIYYYDSGQVDTDKLNSGIIEGGIILKLNWFAIDIGAGGYAIGEIRFVTVGLGFNF